MNGKSTETVEHTPGPWQWFWRVDDELRADCGVFHEKREGHAYSVCRAPQYQGQKQWEADARLIAAAPELLTALEAAIAANVAVLPKNYRALGGEPAWVVQSRAAIKKARGR